MNNLLLRVQDLKVRFYTLRGVVHALERVTFHLNRQETLGIAGETGCGKSVTARAVLRLIDPPGRIVSGSIFFEDKNLLELDEAAIRKIRGSEISMIMQEPKVSLNPVIRVGDQVAETLLVHDSSLNRRSARRHAIDMLAQLGIPDASKMSRRFPHELSGGMSQRIMIAMMLVTRPKLLIADEPTSALDVTIQAQILELMKALVREIKTAVLMITHDLGVMAETCDRVAVMYAGNVVEMGSVRDVLKNPQHPYTQSLLRTVPDNANPEQPLYSIRGNVPSLLEPQTNCVFAPRCEHIMRRCEQEIPPVYDIDDHHQAACFLVEKQ
ncbi:MAG: ABC transporter ATP-binding protein [Deltaproteobacteria bacterium]|nr:ABC transporter ATP-binding protein [Deltaproteobacteria bacterium]MBW1959911.1 ABC transporter ATP-binding protein [Deltaproteobacteria bacterium]MBW2150425.1 ABC transporter ATP-binding protein [Deltaproteobacteria bacterium]